MKTTEKQRLCSDPQELSLKQNGWVPIGLCLWEHPSLPEHTYYTLSQASAMTVPVPDKSTKDVLQEVLRKPLKAFTRSWRKAAKDALDE